MLCLYSCLGSLHRCLRGVVLLCFDFFVLFRCSSSNIPKQEKQHYRKAKSSKIRTKTKVITTRKKIQNQSEKKKSNEQNNRDERQINNHLLLNHTPTQTYIPKFLTSVCNSNNNKFTTNSTRPPPTNC